VLINRKNLMKMAAVGGFFYLVELTEVVVCLLKSAYGFRTNCNI
jgi:hypothetical protein